jgi:hypothetical protein
VPELHIGMNALRSIGRPRRSAHLTPEPPFGTARDLPSMTRTTTQNSHSVTRAHSYSCILYPSPDPAPSATVEPPGASSIHNGTFNRVSEELELSRATLAHPGLVAKRLYLAHSTVATAPSVARAQGPLFGCVRQLQLGHGRRPNANI